MGGLGAFECVSSWRCKGVGAAITHGSSDEDEGNPAIPTRDFRREASRRREQHSIHGASGMLDYAIFTGALPEIKCACYSVKTNGSDPGAAVCDPTCHREDDFGRYGMLFEFECQLLQPPI